MRIELIYCEGFLVQSLLCCLMETDDLSVLRSNHMNIFFYCKMCVCWKQAKKCNDCSMFIWINWSCTRRSYEVSVVGRCWLKWWMDSGISNPVRFGRVSCFCEGGIYIGRYVFLLVLFC